MTIEFSDSFTEAGSGTIDLSSHTPDTDTPGSGWVDTTASANPASVYRTNDDAGLGTSSGGLGECNIGALSALDYDVIGYFNDDDPTHFRACNSGLTGRRTSTTANDGWLAYYSAADQTLYLVDQSSGGFGSGSYSLGAAISALYVKLECRDSGAKVFTSPDASSWTERISVTGNVNGSNGYHAGVHFVRDSSRDVVHIDDFSVDVNPTGDQSYSVGLVTETDSALGVQGDLSLEVGLAAESDQALAALAVQSYMVGLPQETDSGLSVQADFDFTPGLALETDQALAVRGDLALAVGLAAENDSALAAVATLSIQPGLVVEVDSALGVQGDLTFPVGLVQENDTALGLFIPTGEVRLARVIRDPMTRSLRVVWEGLLKGDVGEPFELGWHTEVSVQVVGTAGAGLVLEIQGLNEPDLFHWRGMLDPLGSALQFSGAGLGQLRNHPRFVRPYALDGDDTTDMDVVLFIPEG